MKPAAAILISGRGSNMQALIDAAAAENYPARIVLVIANRADAPGLAIAQARGVEALAIENQPYGRDRLAHEQAIDACLRAHGVEIICLAGYMRLLTPYLVGRWQGKILNIHPSLLPEFPGLDTHGRALAAGAQNHGCTVHLVTETMDEGPILARASIAVLPDDTADSLAARVLQQEHLLYPQALADFARKLRLPEPAADR